ncbi:LacI family DNA-binding transcriptional regulator [Sphingomonas sp. ERG5]|uniref:LacI family DNA-binding transcriptional regulator n=1 Tax=Sphingomonas sp. ERG5 TaxID=1381597 RepID=UPI00054B3DBA|nr:LacI family DNA-binding transcriptional regulator [Sphingomonas sp. ERG5]
MKPITIKEVAARAGVSPKTVSRVINDEDHVRPPVREQVMRVVREMGYRPNSFARSLSSSKSYLLGLLVDDPASGYAADVQLGALLRSRDLGYHLVIEPLDTATPDWLGQIDTGLRALNLGGAILTPPLCDRADLIAVLERHGLPFVRISPSSDDERSGSVRMDDRAAARDMTRHLIGLGHRDIACIKGDPVHSASGLRYIGFRDAMREAGLSVAPNRTLEGDFSFRSGLRLGEEILASDDRPSAIFASNDDMALGVLVTAIKHGIVVPDTLSVAGFDDAPVARVSWPQLTTVRQPKVEMAAAAVDILTDPTYAANPDKGSFSRNLPYELIVRSSTAPPARHS